MRVFNETVTSGIINDHMEWKGRWESIMMIIISLYHDDDDDRQHHDGVDDSHYSNEIYILSVFMTII